MDMTGKGPFVMVGEVATDVGLYDHVFDGTDASHDELLQMKRMQRNLRSEMTKRGILSESCKETLEIIAENLKK